MPGSTLDPSNINMPDRRLNRGHGTSDLGPSDTSDTGSDVVGGPGFADQIDLDFDSGTTSDIEASKAGYTAGPDVGDANLDSDTDSSGTGEVATAGRDTVAASGQDRDTDHVDHLNPEADEENFGDANMDSTIEDMPIADSTKDHESHVRVKK